MRSLKSTLLILTTLLLSACTTYQTAPPPTANKVSCLPALSQLDQLAEQHAGTLSGHRIPNTPWLRSSRFLHSFQQQNLNQIQLRTLLQRMSQSAISGLNVEIKQVPPAQLKHWRTTRNVQAQPNTFIHNCTRQLLAQQLAQPAQTINWLKQPKAPNDYSTLQRALGLYPIVAVPFRWGVVNEQKTLHHEWGQTAGKPWVSYTPHSASLKQELATKQVQKDALSIPTLNAQQTQQLFAQHAPTWLIDSQSAANKPGTPYKKGNEIAVNTAKPVTYTHLSFGRWQNQITTQLNYIVWFTERPALSTFDWVAGKHDAVIFRIHLDAAENILAYDSIHLCGCWYRLFLPEGSNFQASTTYNIEPVVPERVAAARQMQVYISHDTHQIVDLKPIAGNIANAQTYQLRSFQELVKLPVFDTRGYVPDSERPERWFFWPMGVKNPGAVRRFGTHAVSFVGKRHFDDPYLLREVGMR